MSSDIRAALERLAKAAERVADVDPLAALEVAAALADLAAPMEGDAARAAPQSGLPWPTDGPAVPESREPASVAPEATGQPRPLSPAAQAVLTAATQRLYCLDPDDVPTSASEHGCAIAAALRAVADQVAPQNVSVGGGFRMHRSATAQRLAIRAEILALAAELEGLDA